MPGNQDILIKYGACPEARHWALAYSTPEQLWEACHEPEWMLWALDKLGFEWREELRRFAIGCARRVVPAVDDAGELAGAGAVASGVRARRTLGELRQGWRDRMDRHESSQPREDLTVATVAARSCLWSVLRDRPLDAAVDTSRQALRVKAWGDPALSVALSVSAEARAQTDDLRRILGGEVVPLLAAVRLDE